MRQRTSLAGIICALLLVAVPAWAQEPTTVINATAFGFPASPDHEVVVGGTALVTGYRLLIVEVATNAVVKTYDLGKPAPTGGEIVVTPAFNELSAGLFTADAVAYGPGGEAPKARASNQSLRLSAPRPAGAGTFR